MSQFEFLVMSEKNVFVIKYLKFQIIAISTQKGSPRLFQQPPSLKIKILSSRRQTSSPFVWKFGRTLNPFIWNSGRPYCAKGFTFLDNLFTWPIPFVSSLPTPYFLGSYIAYPLIFTEKVWTPNMIFQKSHHHHHHYHHHSGFILCRYS